MAPSFDTFLNERARSKRLARLTHDIVLPKAHGLEFGPGANPVSLPDTFTVEYVDHSVTASDTVDIRWEWSGSGSLADVCGAVGSFDFAVAAQVAQYVPNLCGWFRGIHEVLRPGGVLNLTLPDKRMIFDARRSLSTVGQIIDADLRQLDRPSPQQIFDHTFEAVALDEGRIWREPIDPATLPKLCGEHALALAREQTERAWASGSYESCHCWVFTPLSFLDVIENLTRVGRFPFVFSQFASTDPGEMEFFVCLRRDKEDDPDRLRDMQLTAIAHVRSIVRRQFVAAKLLSQDR